MGEFFFQFAPKSLAVIEQLGFTIHVKLHREQVEKKVISNIAPITVKSSLPDGVDVSKDSDTEAKSMPRC